MKKLKWIHVFAILTTIYFFCIEAAPLKAIFSEAQAASSAPTTGGKQNWDSLVAAAKKEGIVSVYAVWRPETRAVVTKAFKARYGIDVEFTPFSRTAELLAKVQTEQRASLYLVDVFGVGSSAIFSGMKPAGLLGRIEPMLELPEVTDGKNWSPGGVPFGDKDRTFIAMIASLKRDIFYNTDMIQEGEITDYSDLLKPQYTGKITMNDPTVTGSGMSFMLHLAVNLWDLDRAKAYLTQLVGPQQAVIERNNRIQVEEIAKGKYPIGLAANDEIIANFLKVGAHLGVVHAKQGVRATSAAGTLSVATKLPHPNATKLFINWLLTKEGQTVFSQGFGHPSFRKDVSTKGFSPMFLPQPGEKIWPESEDFRGHMDKVVTMAKQVISAANK